MFYIPFKKDVADWYLEKQRKYCQDTIKSIKTDIKNKVYSQGTSKILIELLDCIEYYLNNILIGKPDVLLNIHDTIKTRFPTAFEKPLEGQENPIYNAILSIFDYNKFTKTHRKFAYKLTKKLGICICPYCNREFIFTVSNSNKNDEDVETECLIRPELDHFFPKSQYPLLALSFCNLIPCGHICNANIKLQKELDLNKHVHPYISNQIRIQFGTDLKSGNDDMESDTINKPEISITCTPITQHSTIEDPLLSSEIKKVQNTIDFFQLQRIYQYHSDIAYKIQDLFREYPPDKISDIVQELKKSTSWEHVTKEKILEILYSEFDIKDPDNEILGQLKKDLYSEIHNLYYNNGN